MKVTTVGDLRKQLTDLPDTLPIRAALGDGIENPLMDADIDIPSSSYEVFVGPPSGPEGLQEFLIMIDGRESSWDEDEESEEDK